MQPKWTQYRDPKPSEKPLCDRIRKRYGKGVKIKVAETPIYQPHGFYTPRECARCRSLCFGEVQAGEKLLTNAAGSIAYPDQWLEMWVTITLNKLDRLPSLRKRASKQEQQARAALPANRDRLKYLVAVFREAYATNNYNKAIIAYGMAANLIGWINARWDDPEISMGNELAKRFAKAREHLKVSTATRVTEQARKIAEAVKAYLQRNPRHAKMDAYRAASGQYLISVRQIKRYCQQFPKLFPPQKK